MTAEFEINLRIGDMSGHGHDKVDVYAIIANKSPGALTAAYKKGTKKLGLDIIKDLCANDQETSIGDAHWEILMKSPLFPATIIEDRTWLTRDEWVSLYMAVCTLGDPTLKWKYALKASWIDIGGYGFF